MTFTNQGEVHLVSGHAGQVYLLYNSFTCFHTGPYTSAGHLNIMTTQSKQYQHLLRIYAYSGQWNSPFHCSDWLKRMWKVFAYKLPVHLSCEHKGYTTYSPAVGKQAALLYRYNSSSELTGTLGCTNSNATMVTSLSDLWVQVLSCLQTKIGWWFSLSTLLGLTMVTSIYCWRVLNIDTATGRHYLEVKAVKRFRYPI